jgi:hypothetical protein
MSFNPGFDYEKLKIKHILGNAKELTGYPDKSDISFYLVETASSSTKDFFFSNQQLSARFQTEIQEIDTILDSLVEDGIVSLHLETSDKKSFKLIKNPFK